MKEITIKKAYICNSVRYLNPGDILFFYKSKDQELTTIGIVEKFSINQQKDDVIKIVGKRTVYTNEEIEKITKKRNLVILFIMVLHLPNTLKLDDLITNNILKKAPQSITNIADKYKILKELGGINGSFTFD